MVSIITSDSAVFFFGCNMKTLVILDNTGPKKRDGFLPECCVWVLKLMEFYLRSFKMKAEGSTAKLTKKTLFFPNLDRNGLV